MQNDPSSIRGYRPSGQTTREQPCYTGPQQPEPPSFSQRMKHLWQQLDPASVFLLGAAVLGAAYALYISISFWWYIKVLAHLIACWAALGLNVAALFSRRKNITLLAALAYGAAILLFLNYAYLLVPQLVLCLLAWRQQE